MTTYSPTALISGEHRDHLAQSQLRHLRGGGWPDPRPDRGRPGGVSLSGDLRWLQGPPVCRVERRRGERLPRVGLSGVPTAAGLALGVAPAAVADDPVAGSRGGSATAAGEGSGGPGPGAGSFAKAPPVSGPGAPGTSSPPGDVPSPTISVPSLPSTSGPITDAVRDVDATAGTNLSGPSRGVTRAVDGAASGVLNQGGRGAGRPGLGTQAGSAVGALPGPG